MSQTLDEGPFFHGTKADLYVGDLLTAGFRSNYRPEVVMNHIYFTATVEALPPDVQAPNTMISASPPPAAVATLLGMIVRLPPPGTRFHAPHKKCRSGAPV